MKLTLADAKAQLREIGMTLTKKDGEYRVNFRNGYEASAYFTDSLMDAIETGRDMAARRDANPELARCRLWQIV